MKKTKILFYSSVKDISLFYTQKFYVIDKQILNELGHDVVFTNSITDFFRWNKYDIGFIYFYRYGFFAALIARLLNKKVFFTGGIDSLDSDYSSVKSYVIQKIFFKLCYMISNQCFIVSKADLLNIQRIYKKKSLNKLCLSYHCIDLPILLAKNSDKDFSFTTVAWMGSVGNVKRKGIDLSLEVFHYLLKTKEFSNYKYYIIGRMGEGTDYLRGIVKSLNLDDKVIFLGEISEEKKISILKESYAYFQLSQYEGFGLAALEALASKNIIIHSGKGGLNDVVADYGIKVNILEKDKEKLFYSIYKSLLIFDPMSFEQAYKYILNNFSLEKRKYDFHKFIK